MAYGQSNGHVTDRRHVTLKRQTRDPNTLRAYISKTAVDRDSVPKDYQ